MLKEGLTRLRGKKSQPWKEVFNRTREGRQIRAVLLSFPTGMLAAMLTLPGGMRPLGMGVAAALPGNCSLGAIAGAVIGYCVSGVFADNLSCLAVLACILGGKLIADGVPRLRSSPAFLSLMAAAFTGIIAAIRCTLLDAGTGEWIFSVAEAALTGGVTYFAFFASRFLLSGKRLREASWIQSTSLLLTALAILTGLTGTEIFLFNPGRIAVCVAVLLAGERRNAACAAETGIVCTAAMTAASPSQLLTGGIYAACGYWAGMFAGTKRIRQTLIFALSAAAAVGMSGESETMKSLFDLLIGCAVFLMIPDKLRVKIPAASRGKPVSFADAGRTSARLRFGAGTLMDLEKTVEAVSEKLYRTGVCSIESVYSGAADQVCRSCGLRLFCWDTAAGQTNDALIKLTPVLKANGKITTDDLPAYFTDRCPKLADLTLAINSLYAQFISKEAARRKIAQAKEVAAEQFEGISNMLAEFSGELREIVSIDTDLSDRTAGMLREMGEDPEEVYCILDRYDRMRIEIYTEKPMQPEAKFLCEELGNLSQRPLDGPSVVSAEDATRTVFYEQARLRPEYGCAQISAHEGRISGDCCDTFSDGKGFFHLILSDGMGTGGRAAVDSIMTVSFILRLIKAGFGFDAALKLINSALLVRTGEETLATIDIGCIDLYTGKTEFLKAGAAPSFVCRDGKVSEISGSSLPAGIIQGIRYERRTLRLREGDVIVMMSDGALSIAGDWIREELALAADQPAQKIADRLANLALRGTHSHPDDITVMAAKIMRA